MFRFSIREVFMATALIALALCWIADRWVMHNEVGLYEAKLSHFGSMLEAEGYQVDIDRGLAWK